jgi:hypothetical protein
MGKGVGVGAPAMEDSTVGTTVTNPRYPNPAAMTIRVTAVRVRCNHGSQVVPIIVCFPDLPGLFDLLKAVSTRLARWSHIR